MQALATLLAGRAGVKAPKVVGAFSANPVADEGYVAQGWADPKRRVISVNTKTSGVSRPEYDDLSPREARSTRKSQEGQFIGHELGHVAAKRYLGTPERADQYLAITGQRSRPLFDAAVLARAGAHQPGPYARDASGLPYQTSGTTHDAANEHYADDFAASLGFASTKDAARARAVKILIARGLLPGRR